MTPLNPDAHFAYSVRGSRDSLISLSAGKFFRMASRLRAEIAGF